MIVVTGAPTAGNSSLVTAVAAGTRAPFGDQYIRRERAATGRFMARRAFEVLVGRPVRELAVGQPAAGGDGGEHGQPRAAARGVVALLVLGLVDVLGVDVRALVVRDLRA